MKITGTKTFSADEITTVGGYKYYRFNDESELDGRWLNVGGAPTSEDLVCELEEKYLEVKGG